MGGATLDDGLELRQLAHLLRVGASTAREIADLRKLDVGEIHDLASQAEHMAARLDQFADKQAPEHLRAGYA